MGNVIMKAQQITYGASNVEKALNDLKAPELIELNKRMDAIDAWKANVHEETYTGTELTIENALALPARSLITSINAIQDLHGYDKPWVGGSGKNKFDISKVLPRMPRINCENGVITVYAYASNGEYPDLLKSYAPNLVVGQTYTLSAVSTSIQKFIYLSNTGKWNFGESRTITQNDLDSIVYWYNDSEGAQPAEITNVQIEEGSTATSYAPYSNICPISGRTEARVDTENEDSTESAYAVIQLGQTVYGADINWDTGVMTVKTTAVDGGSLNWSYWDSGIFIATIADKTALNVTDIKCSCYKRGREDDGIFCLVDNDNQKKIVYIWDSSYSPDATGAAALKTALTGQQIEYRLANPTTLQLTPTQLELLKGYNRVTVTSGYATIELKALVLGGDN